MSVFSIIIIVIIFLIIFNRNMRQENYNFIKGIAVHFQHVDPKKLKKMQNEKKTNIIADANNNQSILKKYFDNISINPVSYNKSIVYPKIYGKIPDDDINLSILNNILNTVNKKSETQIARKLKINLSRIEENNLIKIFMDKIIKGIPEGEKFSYIKTILPGLKYIINETIHKYIILISIKDTNEIPDDLKDETETEPKPKPKPKPKTPPNMIKKMTNKNYILLLIFEKEINKKFNIITDIADIKLLGYLPEDKIIFNAKNYYDSVFDLNRDYTWYWKHNILPTKETIKKEVKKAKNKKLLNLLWTDGKNYCEVVNAIKMIKLKKELDRIKNGVLSAEDIKEERIKLNKQLNKYKNNSLFIKMLNMKMTALDKKKQSHI